MALHALSLSLVMGPEAYAARHAKVGAGTAASLFDMRGNAGGQARSGGGRERGGGCDGN